MHTAVMDPYAAGTVCIGSDAGDTVSGTQDIYTTVPDQDILLPLKRTDHRSVGDPGLDLQIAFQEPDTYIAFKAAHTDAIHAGHIDIQFSAQNTDPFQTAAPAAADRDTMVSFRPQDQIAVHRADDGAERTVVTGSDTIGIRQSGNNGKCAFSFDPQDTVFRHMNAVSVKFVMPLHDQGKGCTMPDLDAGKGIHIPDIYIFDRQPACTTILYLDADPRRIVRIAVDRQLRLRDHDTGIMFHRQLH